MDDNSSVLVRIGSALSSDRVGAIRGFSGPDVTVLEHDSCVSEYEIDSPVDIAVSVELSFGMDVESVLVSFEAALVEYGEIGAGAECHGLVILTSGCVSEGDPTTNKCVPFHSCNLVHHTFQSFISHVINMHAPNSLTSEKLTVYLICCIRIMHKLIVNIKYILY